MYTPKIALLSSQIKQIVFSAHKHLPDASIFLFGSRVKGTARVTSDVDIALKNVDIIPSEILQEMKTELEEKLPFFVDVVDLRNLSDSFYAHIKDDLVEINE